MYARTRLGIAKIVEKPKINNNGGNIIKRKKYKVIRNNRHVYAVKKMSNKGYINSQIKRIKRK